MANKMLGLLGRLLGVPYASNYVVGVLAGTREAEAAAAALRKVGFDNADIVLQPGSTTNERIQHQGFSEAVQQAATEEGTICMDYNELARQGAILSMYTRTDAEVERARKTLSDHNARSLKHFGNGTITDLDSA